MKIIVLTANYGGKDNAIKQEQEKGVKYYCYTEEGVEHPGWESKHYDHFPEGMDDRLKARTIKTLTPIKENYDYLIWIDGNLKLTIKPSELIKKYTSKENKKGFFVASRRHPTRNCAYEEALAVLKLKVDTEKAVVKWFDKVNDEGYPQDHGLHETGLLIYNNTLETETFKQEWYDMIMNYSRRDQLSFNYLLWKNNYKCKDISREEIKWNPHKRRTTIKY